MRTLKAHQISALAFLTVLEIFGPKMLSFRKEGKKKKKKMGSHSVSLLNIQNLVRIIL